MLGDYGGNLLMRVLMCGPIAQSGGVSTHTKYLTKYLKKQNVDVKLFNLSAKNVDTLESTGLRKIYQRTIGLFIEAYNKKEQYDLIHIQASGGLGGFIPAVSAVLISKIIKKKLIVTFHHGQIQKFIKRYQKLFGYVLKNANNMIVVSNFQKRVINDISPQHNDKLIVISNGYDSMLFYPIPKNQCREKLGLPINKKIIINVSNLVKIKGHLYLIDAMVEVVKHRQDVLLIIVGDGYMKNRLTERVKELKLENYIMLVGRKNHEEIPIWLNSSDLFVLPSLAEGNPTVMFESLSCGVPFIGTNIAGIPEIINSEDYGLLVKPRDPRELSQKILYGLQKGWDKTKIIDYAKNFTWGNIAERTVEVLSLTSPN